MNSETVLTQNLCHRRSQRRLHWPLECRFLKIVSQASAVNGILPLTFGSTVRTLYLIMFSESSIFSISPFSLLWSFSIKMKSNVRPYFCMMALQYLRMAALSSFSSCDRLISSMFSLVFSISSKRLILRLYLAFIAGKETSKSTPLGKSW